jgi:integrase
MAAIQARNGSYRVIFRHDGKQHTFWVGQVEEFEAQAVAARVDYWLMRLKQRLVELPPGVGIVAFVQADGKPPAPAEAAAAEITLAGLRQAYFRSQENKLEATTLDAIRLHFDHLERVLGPKRPVTAMARADLQAYADKRASEWIDPDVYRRRREAKRKSATPEPRRPKRHPSAATIKKEIISLRTAWNWARRNLGLKEEYPGSGLAYAKVEEGLPFMTWDEAQRRVAAGDSPEKVWDCVYLRPHEVAELLAWVAERPVSPWVHPMFCFAAYTGARRSEMVRALPSDIDLAGETVTLREKKRDQSRYTTRRVPLVSALKDVLERWMIDRAPGRTLFCKADGKEVSPREAHNYLRRALRLSKWRHLRGWHALRHSFVSACASKGVDQRMLQEWCGHMSAAMSRRYAHLWPSVQKDAIKSVFG